MAVAVGFTQRGVDKVDSVARFECSRMFAVANGETQRLQRAYTCVIGPPVQSSSGSRKSVGSSVSVKHKRRPVGQTFVQFANGSFRAETDTIELMPLSYFASWVNNRSA